MTNLGIVSGHCPACGSKLRFDAVLRMGEFVVCPECDTELEVIQAAPLKFDWAYAEPLDELSDEEWDDFQSGDYDSDAFDNEDVDFAIDSEDWE